jgi:hypothetical protein
MADLWSGGHMADCGITETAAGASRLDGVPAPDQSVGPSGRRLGSRTDVLAAIVCAAVGLVLAVAPHLITLARYGTVEYLGDGDDVYYLAVSRIPYHGEATLRDPLSSPWDPRPTLHAWLQFVPLAVLTRRLGLQTLLTPLVWRTLGGALLGLTLFVLFRRLLAGTRRPTAWALGCALVCLADAGFALGQTLYGSLTLFNHLLSGTTPLTKPDGLGQYRVVTPLLNIPALLALAAVIVPPESGRRRFMGLAAGVLALTVCIHLYFFFWTAAVLGMGLYLGALAIAAVGKENPSRRRSELTFVAMVLLGGILLGSPQIYTNARAFADPEVQPILQRMSRGQKLPAGHPAVTRHVRKFWVFAKLAFGAAAIVVLGAAGWRLMPVWVFTAAGYLLANSAIVTGLEFENFHWDYVHSTFGEVLLLGSLALLLDRQAGSLRPPWGRLGACVLWSVPVGLTLIALAWRPFEAVHAPEAVAYGQTLRALGPLRPALARLEPRDVLAGPWQANVALLPGYGGQLYQFDQTAVSSMIPDTAVHERHALNAWLRGLTLEQYLREAARDPLPSGEITDPTWTPAAVRQTRGDIFRDLLAGRTAALLDRYRPSVLLRPTRSGPPPRYGPWVRVAPDAPGEWALWRRDPDRDDLAPDLDTGPDRAAPFPVVRLDEPM